MGVRGTLGLCQDILNANTFKYSTHSAAGYHSSTRSSGAHQHASTAIFGSLLVRNSTLEYGHLDEILLCRLYTLGNGSRNFTSLTKAIAYDTITIANYHNSSECERSTALGHLGYTVECHQFLCKLFCVYIYSTCHIF